MNHLQELLNAFGNDLDYLGHVVKHWPDYAIAERLGLRPLWTQTEDGKRFFRKLRKDYRAAMKTRTRLSPRRS
jgi:hypothetical protein